MNVDYSFCFLLFPPSNDGLLHSAIGIIVNFTESPTPKIWTCYHFLDPKFPPLCRGKVILLVIHGNDYNGRSVAQLLMLVRTSCVYSNPSTWSTDQADTPVMCVIPVRVRLVLTERARQITKGQGIERISSPLPIISISVMWKTYLEDGEREGKSACSKRVNQPPLNSAGEGGGEATPRRMRGEPSQSGLNFGLLIRNTSLRKKFLHPLGILLVCFLLQTVIIGRALQNLWEIMN